MFKSELNPQTKETAGVVFTDMKYGVLYTSAQNDKKPSWVYLKVKHSGGEAKLIAFSTGSMSFREDEQVQSCLTGNAFYYEMSTPQTLTLKFT